MQILDEIAVSNLCPILMTRDPRDCEQSWYHARYLHTSGELAVMPIESASLPESLVHEETFDIDIRDLLAFTRKHDGLILRYEDMVLEPLAFLNKFIDFTGLPIKRSAVDCALVMANFVQAGRDEGAHNRSGAPYSAVHTLPREMLEKLNKRFGALIVDMGYPLWPDEAPVIDLVPLMERDATKRFTMALAEENGFRIDEIRELHDKLAGQAQELVELKHENGLRVDGIRQVKHGLEAARISIAALRQENGFRTDEIRQLASDGLEAKERQFLECVIANQADRIRMLEDDFSQMATASIASLIVARIKRRLGLRLAQEIQGGGGDGLHKIV
ncbi:MAG: sulfotransferase domain-containing protein [Gammaproteobacteria bacterium]|nr:sulfotransferase domain-containing protein [Gammaproteobacteria bacterium]MBU1654566.1 sulfotransferase domain-containing protein [Gammaproteobacteria bacterium]MBU1961958.1 sulfotransferase domain-containing protein [Gammaproteobacteria bacterium]